MEIKKGKKILEVGLLVSIILLLGYPIVTGVTVTRTVADTFTGGLHESVAVLPAILKIVTSTFHLLEVSNPFPPLLVIEHFHLDETLVLLAGTIAKLSDSMFKFVDGQCTICLVVTSYTITQSISIATTTLIATDTPTDTVITGIIVPIAIIFVMLGIIAIKFPLAGFGLMLTVGVMTFIYLAYLGLLPPDILLLVAIVGAGLMALLISKWLGNTPSEG